MQVSTVILLLLWILAYKIVNRPIIIPSPKSTLYELIKIVTAQGFLLKIFYTVRRIYICFFVSFVVGIVLGFFSAFSDKVYYLLKPLILVLKSIPTMAITLIAIIWLKSDFAPILVGFLVVFPIVYNTVIDAIKNIDNDLIEMTDVYNFSFKKKVFSLYVPSVKQTVINITTSTMGLLIKVIVAAEILVQPKISVGAGFQVEKISLNTAGLFAWCIIVIVLVALIEYVTKKALQLNQS